LAVPAFAGKGAAVVATAGAVGFVLDIEVDDHDVDLRRRLDDMSDAAAHVDENLHGIPP
jgi:hypothetical protein